MDPWALYDDLLDLVPGDRRVRSVVVSHWAAVTDDAGGAGVAGVYRGGPSDGSVVRNFKRVAVIGHFGNLEQFRDDPDIDLTVLERRPVGADLPDPAAEYVLPGCDLVFITGSTVVNKTLPRLLELSRGAEVMLVGPTTPLAPEVFAGSVDELAGALVTAPDGLMDVVSAGGSLRLLRHHLQQYNVPLGAKVERQASRSSR